MKEAQTKKTNGKNEGLDLRGKENKATQSSVLAEEPVKDNVNADSIETIFDGQQYMKA